MDQKFQTSFIPKKPVLSARPARSSISLFLLVSLIVFFITLGLAGYVFLEKNLLIQNITSEQNVISTNKNGIVSDQATVESLIELNARINAANVLLAKHTSVSPVFAFLQQVTLQNVRFNDFQFSVGGTGTNGQPTVHVTMNGTARDWPTVAAQADEFALPSWRNIMSNPKISNLSQNADNSISFTFTADINPSFILYGGNANGAATSASSTN